jgi:serine/threonine protein kinase
MVKRAGEDAGQAATQSADDADVGPEGHVSAGATVLAGRYRLLRPIGTGGMGTVYEGEHLALGHRVAVKMLHPQYAASETSTKRFMNEARAAARMRHPNVARCEDVGITPDGQPFLVLEFLEGRDLADEIAETHVVELSRALSITRQVASALGYAHAEGVVHRDLKPENIFLARTADGREVVKVLDFGVARFIGLEHTSGTRTGAAIGTPLYMAPEQFTDASRVDARADVYGLGVVLYEMLTGTRPFDAGTLPELLSRMNSGAFKPIVSLRDGVPRHVALAVESSLCADPDSRPESMDAFVSMLEGARPAPPQAKRKAPWQRASLTIWLLAGALLVLSATVSFLLLRPEPSPPALPVVVPSAPRPEPVAPAADAPVVAPKPEQAEVQSEPVAEPQEAAPAAKETREKRARRRKSPPRDRSIDEEPDF